MMRTCVALVLALALGGLRPAAARAGWELPSVIGTDMVLQRETAAPLWGWDEPGARVTVSISGREVAAQAGQDGLWRVQIPTGAAGGPFVLRITGTREAVVEGVLVGEVWVAGGQSNMWWHQGGCKDAERERAGADFPLIRIWDANTSSNQGGWQAAAPQRTVRAQWRPVSPAMLAETPGVPFFFARELHQTLRVPVGIVHLAVPGQAVATFLSPAFIAANLPQGDPAARTNAPPPSCFYNGMVAPAAPFAARGFLWWQGESDAARHLFYRVLFPGLIEDWRHAWGLDQAPFLFVELANFLKPQAAPVEDDTWPALRHAQSFALALDRVYGVSAINVLGPDESPFNIHPPNKQLIGRRLALAARANVYGESRLVWSGPRFKAAAFEKNRVILTFGAVGGGLKPRGGKELKGFALAGADRRFKWAEARAEGDTVVLSSPEVPCPVAARYAWANNPVGNLVNAEGLPAFPFRTDFWNLCEEEHGREPR